MGAGRREREKWGGIQDLFLQPGMMCISSLHLLNVTKLLMLHLCSLPIEYSVV